MSKRDRGSRETEEQEKTEGRERQRGERDRGARETEK